MVPYVLFCVKFRFDCSGYVAIRSVCEAFDEGLAVVGTTLYGAGLDHDAGD